MPTFIVIMKIRVEQKNKFYVYLAPELAIQGFTTKEAALRFFSDAYNTAHSRSYEASMSACLSFLFFTPSIVSIESVDDVLKWTENPNKLSVESVHALCGGFKGLPLDTQKGEAVWNSGVRPELITEGQIEGQI